MHREFFGGILQIVYTGERVMHVYAASLHVYMDMTSYVVWSSIACFFKDEKNINVICVLVPETNSFIY